VEVRAGDATTQMYAGMMASPETHSLAGTEGCGGGVAVVSGSALYGHSGNVSIMSADVGVLGSLAKEKDKVTARLLRKGGSGVVGSGVQPPAGLFSGGLALSTGQGGAGKRGGSGSLELRTGRAVGYEAKAGAITLAAGHAAAGQGGGISISAGDSSTFGAGTHAPKDGSGSATEEESGGGGAFGGGVSVASGKGPWGSGAIQLATASALAQESEVSPVHQGAADQVVPLVGPPGFEQDGNADAAAALAATSGSVVVRTGDGVGGVGSITLATGDLVGSGGGDEANKGGGANVAVKVGSTAGMSKGGDVTVEAGTSKAGLGGNVVVAPGNTESTMGSHNRRSGVAAGGTVLLLSGSREKRIVLNDTHVTSEAPGQVSARGGTRAVIGAGPFMEDGREGERGASGRRSQFLREARARLVLDTGSCGPQRSTLGRHCNVDQQQALAASTVALGEGHGFRDLASGEWMATRVGGGVGDSSSAAGWGSWEPELDSLKLRAGSEEAWHRSPQVGVTFFLFNCLRFISFNPVIS
jgi:hypothetical protein